MTGERFGDGRWEVERELARGGMGRVLAARDRVLERRVAVKALLAPSPQAIARLVEEAQLTGQLTHPGIVPLHELGGEGAGAFLVMKLVEGRSLKELVEALARGDAADVERYGLRRVLRLFLEVCAAVAFAHDRGVVHRDLKPANVMVGPADEVLVLDWGVARPVAAAEGGGEGARSTVRSSVRELAAARSATFAGASGDLTQADGVVGTPAYMAPEQAGGDEALDRRADVYALGATLYELLTLRPPYRGGAIEVITRVIQEPPPRPRQAAPGRAIPPALESIVLRAMARDRADRYPDARALARDLERWLDDLPVEAHRETALEGAARWVTRHRVATVTGVVAAVALVGAGLVARAAVRAEQAQLEAQARDADRARAEADAAARTAAAATADRRRAAQAVDALTPTPTILEGFARHTDSILALAAPAEAPKHDAPAALGGGAGATNARTLEEAHADARAQLAAIDARLAALATGPADPAVAPLREEVAAAAAVLDRELLEALLGRDPARAVAALEEGRAAPGAAWGAVVRVRAAWRLCRVAEARALAARLPEDGGGDEACAAACRAVRKVVDERPPAEREEALTAALRRAPGAAWLLVHRAEARVMRGDFAGARDDYDQAIRLRRLDAWAHSSRLARTYLPAYRQNMQADPARFAEDLAPSNVEGRLFVARCDLWTHGNWERYTAVCDQVAARDPLAGHRARAEGALLVARLDEAEAAADAALGVDPLDRVGMAVRAEAALRRGDVDAAEDLASRGLAAHPSDPWLERVRGRVALGRGQRAPALEWLERGTRPSLDSADWAVLALARADSDREDDWAKGVEEARRGLAIDCFDIFGNEFAPTATPIPGDPRLHRALGRLRLKQGKPAAAALHFARAFVFAVMMNHPQRALGRRDRQDALACGEAHEALGLVDEARAWYQLAAEDPECAGEAGRRLARLSRPR